MLAAEQLDGAHFVVIRFVLHMAIRTVRLDEEAEQALAEIRRATGLRISEALKRGLQILREETRQRTDAPHDLYEQLDLGPGGYAVAPSSEAKQAAKVAIRRKHSR